MGELRNILLEEYSKKASIIDPRALLEMVEEILEVDFSTVNNAIKEEVGTPAGVHFDPQEMLLKMVPDVAVSEIGWSDVRTVEDGSAETISGPQRKLLVQFLSNIDGSTFEERIKSLAQFYESGSDVYEGAVESRGDLIAKTISYLVFYKTLTKVITNFNASSAGFSFESFLGALVDGEQIKANTGTIADYLDKATGQNIPVSLKLYKEKQLEVGGSFTALVNDLVEPQFNHPLQNAMRYVVCTKDLSGEGLEQAGVIRFFQFDFTLDNLMDIVLKSKEMSQQCIRLPQQVVSQIFGGTPKAGVGISGIPERGEMASDEEMEKIFVASLKKRITEQGINVSMAQVESLLKSISWAKNEEIFQAADPARFGGVAQGVVRGVSKMVAIPVKKIVKDMFPDMPWRGGQQTMITQIGQANADVMNSQSNSKKKDDRARFLSNMEQTGEFLSPEDSAIEYKKMGTNQKLIALKYTLGYLRRLHFSLNQTQALNPSAPTNTIALGEIKVGTKYVAEAVERVKNIINEEVYEIFQSLKILSDTLNTYFAGGLKNDSQAGTAVQNAENIVTRTEDIRDS